MSEHDTDSLPIAVIGGGPVGLASLAHLVERHLPARLYEAGPSVAASVRNWGHVRLFTPWRHCLDSAAVALLTREGWAPPPSDCFPTGNALVDGYLQRLADLPAIASRIETDARVTAISRFGIDKVVSAGRDRRPFVLTVATETGPRRDLVRAVIDASGTWTMPNPLGSNGLPADGETDFADRIAYGIPDILGSRRDDYAGRTTLVVGSGHSAANALLDLADLAASEPSTGAVWATRGSNLTRLYGGGGADHLPARGDLGSALRRLVMRGRVSHIAGIALTRVREANDRLLVDGATSDGARTIGPVDRIVVATGQRPDLAMTRELRLDLDPWLECARALGPMIDPNVHACGSVPPHGHRELAHPETGFYTVGVKSYGRAPTFLLLTGYEQVRSVAAALAGDIDAADRVRLVLPETGVCTTSIAAEPVDGPRCCGTVASEPATLDACRCAVTP